MSDSVRRTGNALAALSDPEAWLRMQEEKAQEDRAAAAAAGVYLGEGATDRAYDLIAKGLLFEEHLRQEYRRGREEAWAEAQKRGRGRPTVDRSKDADRAYFLWWIPRNGRTFPKIGDLIEYAIQLEAEWVQAGRWPEEERMFGSMITLESLRSSISNGRKQLGMTKADLLLGKNQS